MRLKSFLALWFFSLSCVCSVYTLDDDADFLNDDVVSQDDADDADDMTDEGEDADDLVSADQAGAGSAALAVEAPLEEDAVPIVVSSAKEKTADNSSDDDGESDIAEEVADVTQDTKHLLAESSDEESDDGKDDKDDLTTQAPKVPKKIKQDSLVIEELGQDEESLFGIDTIDLKEPSGNWLYKRIWWEKSELVYSKIKTAITGIMDSRMRFFEARVDLDRTVFDPFYLSLGLTRAELQDAILFLIDQLQAGCMPQSIREKQYHELITLLQEEQKTIETLKKSVEAINRIDHAVDDAIGILMDQINVSRGYEQEAWEKLRSISRELSDKVARNHYYEMDTIWQNVKNIQQYIVGAFSSYFDQLQAEAKEKTAAVTQYVQKLKEKGIDLKAVIERSFESDDQELNNDDDKDAEVDGDQASVGWIALLKSLLWWPFQKFIDLWQSLFG